MDVTELADRLDIGWHWQGAYKLSVDEDGTLRARRVGFPACTVTGETVDELRGAIKRDYNEWLASLHERCSV